ncbi:MAG: nucleoside monophosphate kinase [Patescibacteria group bacterium]|nr:nucleoside monophosphate kinase [Patescibacteria group bacterium]MCL5224310.1 nucleoside monophosphate kinase [Patescibacteria group bacterium]
MKGGIEFPVYKTKREGLTATYDLSDPAQRKLYFEAKLGPEIKVIKKFLKKKAFVAFLIGKKNTGKGTYSKLFMEVVGNEHVGHLSVGDLVRDVHKMIADERGRAELANFLKDNYRGFNTVDEIFDLIEGRSQEKLMSSELILALIKYEIARRPRQALFIDGFPRALDQVNYTLFLKDILGYKDHPDFLVFIDVPESVIDERIKYRVVCPICKTPRNTRLLATKDVGYDEKSRAFYLMCDNPTCHKARMLPKEGDELGIEPIRARLEADDQVFKQLLNLKGIPKVYLRNTVPVDKASSYVDNYEITPGYEYELEKETGFVKTIEKPWIVKDDNGVPSYSLLPPAVVAGLIARVARLLADIK